MDGDEDEKQKMRDAARKVLLGSRSNIACQDKPPALTPRWQTLIDDHIIAPYRASMRRKRGHRSSIGGDSYVVDKRPMSMLDIPYGKVHLDEDTRTSDEDETREDNPEERRQERCYVPMYGRLWKPLGFAMKEGYVEDAANGGPDVPREAVALSRFSERSQHAESFQHPLGGEIEMVPYVDYRENDRDVTAETNLDRQSTLQIRRRSFDAAVGHEFPEAPPAYSDVVSPSAIELMDIERGQTDHRDGQATTDRRDDGADQGAFASMKRRAVRVFCEERSLTKVLCIIIAVIGILGLIVFLGVFPESFVYVEYYQIALKRDTLTGVVDRDNVYYPGCYVLGPTTEFVTYPSTAHFISKTDEIFSVDRLIITLTYSFQYFIRPNEVGKLHKDFEKDYNLVIEKIAQTSLKNEAGQFSVNEYRLNRPRLEKHFHNTLIKYLQGNCCKSCCPKSCANNTVCSTCKPPGTCDEAYHVDITYFQMGKVAIPEDVFERFLQNVLLQVYAEREYFYQEHQVEVKTTERMTKNLTNQAAEVLQNSTAEASKIGILAAADKEVKYTDAYIHAIKTSCSALNITNQDHKLSFFMQRVLEDAAAKDHLYRGYSFEKDIIMTN